MTNRALGRAIAVFAVAIILTLFFPLISPDLNAQSSYRAIMIPQSGDSSVDFWNFVIQGAQSGAKENNVDLTVMAPKSAENVDEQIRFVEEAINARPDFIILAPTDRTRLIPAARAVKEAGIRLILMDSTLEPGDSSVIEDCFVGIDNKAAAKELAAQLADSMPNGGQVAVLVATPSVSTLAERVAGIQEYLALRSDIDIVEVAVCGDSVEGSRREMQRLLDEYPDLVGIIGTNPVCTEGAARALASHPNPNRYVFYAFDTSAAQNQYLEQGIVDGFVAQIAFNLGFLSVDAGVEACSNRLRTRRMDSGYVYATRENMREDNIQQLIYPFVAS